MPIENGKQDVLKVRMDLATLQMLEQARQYVGLDKSKFIRQSVREKAEAIIAEHQQTRFSQEDWQLFFELLDHPPEPTERMKKALQTYNRIVGDEV
ncbi:DUF1778 domain-containing protein [Methylomonas sp. HYX-M1]|uniref:type II toxin-antitoxin system TacA family antitoxin n=1 Tax=Methylomonas sp. HYX-M1 TaxID=3139307 RepID=UPI00345C3E77